MRPQDRVRRQAETIIRRVDAAQFFGALPGEYLQRAIVFRGESNVRVHH